MSESIYIIPFGYIESEVINYLIKELTDIFQAKIQLVQKQPVPKVALNQYRDQYRASAFLDTLQNIQKIGKLIGLCDVDIYAKNLDFVFGLADPVKRVAIVSLTRLRPMFYNMYQDDSIFWSRVLKETMHELGYLYGLENCHRQECVMHVANSIMDVDIKSQRFCGECRRILESVIEKTITP